VHWERTNQPNQTSTAASTASISISANGISPPRAKAPLPEAHINQAIGSTPAMADA